MANLTVTAANVRPLDGSVTRHYNAGAAGMAPGDAVHVASDGDVEKTDANVSNAAAAIRGLIVAIQGGKASTAIGDRLTVAVFGPVAGFSGLTPGAPGYVSNDAGKLEDAAGAFTRIAGYAESATVFFVCPEQSTAASS
jgi:hypothetical protein